MVTRRAYLRAVGLGALATGAGCSGSGGTLGTEFGVVTESGTLLPANPPQSFGRATDIADDGSTVLVGAPGVASTAAVGEAEGVTGRAYVFTRGDDGWNEQDVLTGSDDRPTGFGVSVALADGGTALVGSSADGRAESDPGTASVFSRDGDQWTHGTTLTPPDSDELDFFGGVVALDTAGTTALVAGTRSDGRSAGADLILSLFSETEMGWVRTATLRPGESDALDPSTVDIAFAGDGSTVLVGGQVDDARGEDVGAVYVFETEDGTWRRQTKLVPDDWEKPDFFGGSVSLSADGTRALVGASGDGGPNEGDPDLIGSVYLFTRDADGWTRRTKLRAPRGRPNDLFGEMVAMGASGRQALVGAAGLPVDGLPTAGGAYRFVERAGNWVLAAKLVSSAPRQGQFLGQTVAFDAGTTILGTQNLTDSGPNSVYVFDP